jgi:hypothetical protein
MIVPHAPAGRRAQAARRKTAGSDAPQGACRAPLPAREGIDGERLPHRAGNGSTPADPSLASPFASCRGDNASTSRRSAEAAAVGMERA